MSATLNKILRKTLDNFKKKELKRFKHLLHEKGEVPRGHLEKADINEIVEVMVQVYTGRAGSIMVAILRQMKLNHSASNLEMKLLKKRKFEVCFISFFLGFFFVFCCLYSDRV